MKKESTNNSLPDNKQESRERIGYDDYHSQRFFGIFLPRKGRKLRTNRYMFHTCFFIVLLFFGMIAYMSCFMIFDSQRVISNPYNRRTETLNQQIVRGSIYSADKVVLAETVRDEEGDESRSYPWGRMFAHAVGYASHGKGGLEGAFNYELMTSHADIMSQIGNGITNQKNPGDSLMTTLDTRLQEVAYEALGDYQGSVIAIEPSTGKIRALVSKPDFDPNTLEEIWNDIVDDDSSSVLLNRAMQGLYPPGSTYKTITAMEYLMEHPLTYNDFVYECKGETIVDSVHINCYENSEHGKETLEDAFTHSCNTAFVTLGSGLDLKSYIHLNKELMFGKEIKSDLKIKQSRFAITDKTDKSSLPQTVIGQGETLMTPMHNALVMCAIANDGRMMRPMLVDEIRSQDDVTIKTYSPRSILEFDEDEKSTLPVLKKMLRKVVTEGTAMALDTERYTVAGKTGSAENEKERAHSWFVGYSNVEDPDLVVCVIAENTGAGSKYAVPIAKEVFDAYYDYGLNEVYR